jgi:signal transduction histidine kinase/CheY-like chemotaxis protein
MNRIHPDDRATAYADLSADFQSGGHVSISRILLPSGAIRFIEGRTAAERDVEARVMALYGSVLDVTARIETEQRLLRARDLAEQATSRQTAFAANLSHELRTPLTAIVGYAHLLAKCDELPSRARRDVDHIRQAGTALLAIANNVLGQSRAAATITGCELAPLDVRQIVDSALGLFSHQARQKSLRFAHVADDALPACLDVHGDALTQILVNLIGNALKFTDAGSIIIRTRYDERVESLSIDVEDTGRGFAEGAREAMFQRFSCGGDAHDLPSGAGLGLSICKGLVDALGGRITATSTPGEGSCFTVSIHASRSQASDPPEDTALAAIDVLVVEDNPAISEIARRLLEALGARTVLAHDGASALHCAMANSFDLILIDLNLPDVRGETIAVRIREMAGPNARSRLVAFTAAEVNANLLAASFDGYLAKPIDPQKLAEVVLAVQRRAQTA